MQRLRAENDIDRRRAAAQLLAFLRGDATADRNNHVRFRVLERFPAADLRKDFFLRLFADGAGVEQKDIRLLRRIDRRDAVRHFEHGEHFR